MIDRICNFLTKKIREENPEIDDERAEVINYGIQLIVGEIPKIFIMLAIAFALGVGKLALISFLLILPYRKFSGGFHLHTHIGCIVFTTLMYCGNVFLAQYLPITEPIKLVAIIIVWVFGIVMCCLYAPADTENLPILVKKDRKQKKILACVTLTIMLIIAMFIENNLYSSMIIYGMFIQTISITKLAYRITKNKYGYEVYGEQTNLA